MTTHEPTVFVLDDDLAIQESLSTLLQIADLPAEFFSTVSEFLDAYDLAQPGCLLLDLRLPGDGFELLKTAADSNSSLPIIVMTGHGDTETMQRAMKLGAVAFFRKPCRADELLDCIRQVIEQSPE